MERLTADLNIIQTLADQPAMPARELKAKFDEAGNIIKNFLNDQLLDELEDWQTSLNESITASMTNLENRVDSRLTTLETNLTSQMNNLDSSLRSYVDTKTNAVSSSLSSLTTKMNGALLVQTWRQTSAWYGDHDRDNEHSIPNGYTFIGLINPFNNSGNHLHTAQFYVRSATSNKITVSCYYHGSDTGSWTYGYSLLFAKSNSNILNG